MILATRYALGAGRSAAMDCCEVDILLGHGRPDAESWWHPGTGKAVRVPRDDTIDGKSG